MAGESFAIIAVILVMDVMLLRSGKTYTALLSIPLISVPLFYLLGIGVAALIPLTADMLNPGMVVAGAIIGVAGCGAMTLFIKNKAYKTTYFLIGTVYLVALAIAYLMRLVII